MARIDPNNIEKWENIETPIKIKLKPRPKIKEVNDCLLYTSDAADE